MRNLLTKNHLTIKKIFNKFLTQPKKALENMTGYQKIKKENEILWAEVKGWIRIAALKTYSEKDPKYQEYVDKEIAWIQKLIRDIQNETEQTKN